MAESKLEAEFEEALSAESDQMPKLVLTRDHVLLFVLFVISAAALLYFVLPRLAGLPQTWERIQDGNPIWLVAAFLLEIVSFLGYVGLFRVVCIRGHGLDQESVPARIDWRESYQITMAGLAATRLFAAAGAGGIALTAWALRRSGLRKRVVALRLLTFMILLYGIYMITLVVGGFGLWFGVFPGEAPFGVTVIPALVGLTIIIAFFAMALTPGDFERRLAGAKSRGRVGYWAHRAAAVPALVAKGMRAARAIIRTRDLGLFGAFVWWGFDIATLWASFHAFGEAPTAAVVVTGYFVGMLANFLPLPGGIGGVEGGMIGAFIAFGVPGGLALVVVLVYRAFAFWLPTIPGAFAYMQLRKTVSRWRDHDSQAVT